MQMFQPRTTTARLFTSGVADVGLVLATSLPVTIYLAAAGPRRLCRVGGLKDARSLALLVFIHSLFLVISVF